jgi:hypothetical protein
VSRAAAQSNRLAPASGEIFAGMTIVARVVAVKADIVCEYAAM